MAFFEFKQGLIVNISSAGGLGFIFNAAYGVGKCAMDRMAADMNHELRNTGTLEILQNF